MSIRAKRGTTAQINAAAAQNGLKLSELIYDTDKGSLEVATGAGSRQAFMKEAFATKAQAESGTDNTLPMTPLRTAQAINVLGYRTTDEEVFTSSGTFMPEADDVAYIVSGVGGGSSGAPGGAIVGGGYDTATSIGGSAGYYCETVIPAHQVIGPVAVQIGAGGAKRAGHTRTGSGHTGSSGNQRNAGGATSFGDYFIASGGNQTAAHSAMNVGGPPWGPRVSGDGGGSVVGGAASPGSGPGGGLGGKFVEGYGTAVASAVIGEDGQNATLPGAGGGAGGVTRNTGTNTNSTTISGAGGAGEPGYLRIIRIKRKPE